MVPAGGATDQVDHTTCRSCSTRATSSSTAATRAGPTTRSTPRCWRRRAIGFVDCGVSGGVWGLENGYALMCGGDADHVATDPAGLRHPEARWRLRLRARRQGRCRSLREDGAQRHRVRRRCRPIAEGWELLEKAESVDNVREVLRSWREGTVIRSWLLDLLVAALDEDEHLDQIAGYAEDSGEGRWTVEAAIEHAVPMPAIIRGAVRPVRVPSGRLAGHEGGGSDAQPVRRSRRQGGRRTERDPVLGRVHRVRARCTSRSSH